MACAESWLQVVHGDAPGSCFDATALDAAKGAIDAVKTQVDSHFQAIGKERERLEVLGGHLREAILRHCRQERDAAATRERLLREAATALAEAKSKLASADSRAGDLLREKEEHQQAVKDRDLAYKEREEKLALREKELGSREDKLASREGTAKVLEKHEVEAARLVNAATQEREALDVRAEKLTAAERSHQDSLKAFQALRDTSDEEREQDILAQVDLECRLVTAAVHAFSQILHIDATFNLGRLLDDVPAEVADDLAKRVRKDAESFTKTFGPEKIGEEGRRVGPSGGPSV